MFVPCFGEKHDYGVSHEDGAYFEVKKSHFDEVLAREKQWGAEVDATYNEKENILYVN